MNFVFVTVILFCILTPGFLFRVGYFSPPFSRKFTTTNLINDLTWSIVPGLLIQFTCIGLIECCSDYKIRIDYIGALLLSINDKALITEIFNNIHSHLAPISIYNILLLSFSYVAGFLFHRIVRWQKLDRRYRVFRFTNKWHYILSGEYLDFPDVKDTYQDIDIIIVDVLCIIGNEQYIYSGQLLYHYYTDTGDLDTIHIKYPMRRKLSDDNKEDRYYQIPSKFLMIPYKTVSNINVRYIRLMSAAVKGSTQVTTETTLAKKNDANSR